MITYEIARAANAHIRAASAGDECFDRIGRVIHERADAGCRIHGEEFEVRIAATIFPNEAEGPNTGLRNDNSEEDV